MQLKKDTLEQRMLYQNGGPASVVTDMANQIYNAPDAAQAKLDAIKTPDTEQAVIRLASREMPKIGLNKLQQNLLQHYSTPETEALIRASKFNAFEHNLDPTRDKIGQLQEFAARNFVYNVS